MILSNVEQLKSWSIDLDLQNGKPEKFSRFWFANYHSVRILTLHYFSNLIFL